MAVQGNGRDRQHTFLPHISIRHMFNTIRPECGRPTDQLSQVTAVDRLHTQAAFRGIKLHRLSGPPIILLKPAGMVPRG